MSRITILGTGGMAEAIGGLAVRAGHDVEVSGRDLAKAQALAARIGGGAFTIPFRERPTGAIVILAVPYTSVLGVVRDYGEALAGKRLVDITNPISADLKAFLTPLHSSGAQEIARAAPANAVVVKAFNTQNAAVLSASPVDGRTLDVFVAGDDAAAKSQVSDFIDSLGLRALDVGPLTMARSLEHACMLWLGLMTHSIKHPNFSLGVRLVG